MNCRIHLEMTKKEAEKENLTENTTLKHAMDVDISL